MEEVEVKGRIEKREVAFERILKGRCFVYVNPPPHLDLYRGKVWFKLASNRVQLLEDSNISIAVPHFGAVREVAIYAEVPSLRPVTATQK
jgi:hypothetical protein